MHIIYNIDVILSYSVILKSKPENDRNGETEQLLKHVVQEWNFQFSVQCHEVWVEGSKSRYVFDVRGFSDLRNSNTCCDKCTYVPGNES